MRGIYIHIPFCRQACRYCDFYFTVSLQRLDRFVDALIREIGYRGRKKDGQALETLYLGGGTPSLLSASQLEKILRSIQNCYTFQENPEWTIECNPDDLDVAKIKVLRQLGFNRISIGIQSFHERDLSLMRRSHRAEQAELAVINAHDGGFQNITIDLIYGVPGQRLADWEENLNKALSLPITHLSAYHLSFEPGTVFDHWRKKGRLMPVPEEKSVEQYRILRKKLLAEGFEHYELSNFARGGKVSRHNLLYWSGLPYLGLGPSAHSFDGKNRSWNDACLTDYMDLDRPEGAFTETEVLSSREQYHDYLITSLRTRQGADPKHIERAYGKDFRLHFEKETKRFIKQGSMYADGGSLVIDPGQWLVMDYILRSLFMD